MDKTSHSSPHWRRLAGALALAGLTAAAPAAHAASCESPDTFPSRGGVEDNYAGGQEPASLDNKLTAYLAANGAPRKNFDAATSNAWLAHTFTGLPTGISGAKLRFAACSLGGNSDNDSLLLEVRGGTDVAWYQFLSTLRGGTWNAGDCDTFEIDLAKGALAPGLGLSTDELLTALADGDLQFIVQDDTRVDFAELIVESCPAVVCAGLPRGASAWWPFDETAGNKSKDLVSGAGATWTAGLAADPLGVHGGALAFSGSPAHASAPSHPAFDFGTGDFSIDFWIKTTQASGIQGLLEKRVLSPQALGWTVYLNDGKIGFQLAEGGNSICDSSTPLGCTNYNSSLLNVADGQWHFVAVTVDRNSPTGLKIHVDNRPEVVFDPTLRQGSLSNSAPLLFGAHAAGPGAGSFIGSLDEVELFGTALSRLQVLNLLDAPGGKCKTRLTSEWDIPWCRGERVARARPTLCNDSPADTSFGVRFAPLPIGTYPLGACDVDGPTVFDFAGSQPVLVPAGSCVHLDLEVTPPAGMPAGATTCYQVTAENLDSGQVSASPSSFTASQRRFCIRNLPPSSSLPVSVTVPLFLEVYNGADVQQTFNYRLESMSGDALPSSLRLDGRPPGESVTGQVLVPARGTAEIEKGVQLDELLPTTRQDVLLRDLDEDAVLASRAYTSFVPTPCVADGDTLCLNAGRFEVKVAWRDFIGQTGRGHAQQLTGDTGYFWFFNQANIEVVIKVLDAVHINDRFWVFYGALSSVEYTLTVRDTLTGESASYQNASGQLASVGDIEALPGFTPPAFAAAPAAAAGPAPPELHPEGGCAAGPTVLCLQNGRFRIRATWRTALGQTGPGQAVQLTSETGYFWFFSPNNVELVLKVLDGQTINDHWWVFYGALSDVEYDIEVTDTVANTVKTYHNPLGVFASVGDITAFP